MKVTIKRLIGWDIVKETALATINKKAVTKYPTDIWKKKIIKSEHSPIRALTFLITITDTPYYVAMHLRTHKRYVEFFISTQRSDRTGSIRDKKPQDAPVDVKMLINAQSILNISRKRLCTQADKSTKKAWELVVDELKKIEPELAEACVPNCVYQKGCPEMHPCGYFKKWKEEHK